MCTIKKRKNFGKIQIELLAELLRKIVNNTINLRIAVHP